jgi:diacylglycerol kinase
MSIMSLGRSFLCAIKGITWGVSYDRNTMIHVAIGFSVILISILLKISRLDFIIILFTCFLALTMELLNNGVERLIDVVYPDYNSKVGKIKDLMSGIVLITDIFAVSIGMLVLYKPLIIILNINPVYPFLIFLSLNLILTIMIIIFYIKRKRDK